MKRLLVVLAVVVIAGGAAIGAVLATRSSSPGSDLAASGPPPGPYRGSEPPAGIRIPNVILPSYRGGIVSLRALRGKVLIVTFLDSKCKTKCPIIAALIAHTWPLLTATEKQQVRAYAISVNPIADSRASVRRFLAARHAGVVLDWLVGSVKEMRPVWKAFAVLPATDTGNDDVHSTGVRVFDRRGVWVSDLSAGVDLTPANLAHDIRVALRGAS